MPEQVDKNTLSEEELLAASIILFDTVIRHQVFLQRYRGSIRNSFEDILNDAEADIARIIRDRMPSGASPENLVSVNSIISDAQSRRRDSWARVRQKVRDELRSLSSSEVEFLKKTFGTLGLSTRGPSSVWRTVSQLPFEGRTLSEWLRHIERDDLNRIAQAVKVGLVQGDSPTSTASRVVGTRRRSGRDGSTHITRRRMDGLLRTAIAHVSTQTQTLFLQENPSLADRERYTAILDSRTTPICRSLSGNIYPVGEGPHPPQHFGCRSRRVPFLSNRPPDEPSYQEWLARQSTMFQNETLGLTKARLFRRGGLTLDKFVNRKGDELTLAQLAQREEAAFRAAGLDPKDF